MEKVKRALLLALEALTEGVSDLPPVANRNPKCAALRVKARRAIREALEEIEKIGGFGEPPERKEAKKV